MNIFVLDKDPIKAAQYHCDKHVVKMILETAQMLCTTHHMVGNKAAQYKPTHPNHPCTQWARTSKANYIWLCSLGLALCQEYTNRYGKVHKTQQVIEWCSANIPNLPSIGQTQFVCTMPDYCKISNDPILNYKEFYKKEKIKFAKWKTEIPSWFTNPI